MNSSDLIAVTLTTVAVLQAGMVAWVVHRQHGLIARMTQLLAARTLGEWATAQKIIERPKQEPVAERGDW